MSASNPLDPATTLGCALLEQLEPLSERLEHERPSDLVRALEKEAWDCRMMAACSTSELLPYLGRSEPVFLLLNRGLLLNAPLAVETGHANMIVLAVAAHPEGKTFTLRVYPDWRPVICEARDLVRAWLDVGGAMIVPEPRVLDCL